MAAGILFSGQGAQQVGMGLSVYENESMAKGLWEQANNILDFDLLEVCFNGPNEALTETRVCQPALYVHGYVLFRLYRLMKGDPVGTCLGLSLGELTAHAAAGTFDFETGLRIVAERGRLMQMACEASTGSMASIIGGDIGIIESLCVRHDIEIGNLNCPGQVVISGEKEKLAAAVKEAEEMDFKRVIPLNVAGAYHSRLMEPARVAFKEFLADIEFQEPQIPVFTNTTGKIVKDPVAIKEALVQQVVSPVRWEDCMRGAVELGVKEFYECGPGKILKGLARRIDTEVSVYVVNDFSDVEKLCPTCNS